MICWIYGMPLLEGLKLTGREELFYMLKLQDKYEESESA